MTSIAASFPPAAAEEKDRFPPQIKYIVGNEACERFSFYGMRAILTVFMVQHLGIAANGAEATYHLFVSACYFTPLLGGWIADKLWGKYRTIMWLSLFYCLGHGVLALFEGSKSGLYWGLGLIALGSGGIKPCVSTFVGDQFGAEKKHLIARVYDVFYFAINFGSTFSTLLTPWLLVKYGAAWAFGVPGILMAVATLVFWMGRGNYVHVPPTKVTGKAGFAPIFWHALLNLKARKKGGDFFSAAEGRFTKDEVDGARAALDVFKVFSMITFFWALYDQHGSSWVLQAQQMDLNVLGYRFEASQISAINPILIMVLIPVFAKWIYPWFSRRGWEPTPLRRIGWGILVSGGSFAVAGVLQKLLDSGHVVNVAWQFIPYLLLTVAEIMVSITGLEFAYTQAPRQMKSTIMSFFFLTITAGNLLTAYISEVNKFSGATYFFFFAALAAVMSGVYGLIARRYVVREFIEA